MQKTIQRADLLALLKTLSPALPGRSIITDAQHFVFTEDKVYAYNDEICLQAPYSLFFPCSVPAEELISILSSTNEETITIKEYSADILFFECKGMKSKLAIAKESQIAQLIQDLEQPKRWIPLPSNFTDMLKICSESTSDDMTQGFLTAVMIEKNRMVSSDDLRITMAQFQEPIPILKQILISAKGTRPLVGFNAQTIGITPAWTHFRTDGDMMLSCRKVLEEFPDISGFFELEGMTVEMPKGLKEIVSQVSVFCRKELNLEGHIKFTFENNLCKVHAENNTGWIERSVPCDYSDEPFSFTINPNFLNDLTEQCTHITVSIEEKKALFKAPSFQHIIMLAMD